MILWVVATATFVGYATAQIGLCPQSSGDFPNPSSEQCTSFFRCAQGQPNLLRCPANQRFDFLFKICRPQAQVDCNNQLQIFAAPNSGQSGSGPGALSGAGSTPLGLGGDLSGTLGRGLGGALGAGVGAGLPQVGHQLPAEPWRR